MYRGSMIVAVTWYFCLPERLRIMATPARTRCFFLWSPRNFATERCASLRSVAEPPDQKGTSEGGGGGGSCEDEEEGN